MTRSTYVYTNADGNSKEYPGYTLHDCTYYIAKDFSHPDVWVGARIVRENRMGWEVWTVSDDILKTTPIIAGFVYDRDCCAIPPMHPTYFRGDEYSEYGDYNCIKCMASHSADTHCSRRNFHLNILSHPFIPHNIRADLAQVWENTVGKKPRKRFQAVLFAAAINGIPDSAIWISR